MVQNVVNQPDFNVAARALHATGNGLVNCANLSAVQGGDAILTAIQDLERRMTAQTQALSTHIATLSTRVDNLSTRVDAIAVRQAS
jgi:outer membrane murein-binding lipoprotein Lpp